MIKQKINRSITLIILLSVIIDLVVISFIVDFLQSQNQKKLDQKKITNNVVEKYIPRPTATPTLIISAYTVYDLNIMTKTNDEFSYENFIFKFANQQIRSFDSTQNAYTDSFRIYSSPKTTKNNHQYILMTIKDAEIKSLYEDEQYKVTLTPNDSLDINYLYTNNYCQKDNDCLIKNYLCRYGAFNKYERIRTSYGCEENTYDFQNDYYFGPFDEILKCNSQVTYRNAKCINHQCIGQGRKIECIGKLEQRL